MNYELKKSGESFYEIKKSKFFGFAYTVTSVEQTSDFISKLWNMYSDATHVCWAARISDGVAKYSDDGEPQGTAGKPLYNILEKKNILNCVIAVVRYYGGIQLGAGGLVRAYSHTGSIAIDDAGLQEIVTRHKFSLKVEYTNIDKAKYFLNKIGAVIIDSDYSMGCTMIVEISDDNLEILKNSDLYRII